jgi:alkylation response protein AidB-like acyl-CoA dehydrogenase
MADLEDFRSEVRQLLERNAPMALRGASALDPEHWYWGGRKPELRRHPDSQLFCDLMAERGFTAPTWPKEYGGAGLDTASATVIEQELERLGLPRPVVGLGLQMIGPTLLQFGTQSQKQEHLPKITSGAIRWCQGYSEPNAGSDLASIQTSALVDGSELIINGQKIWTSFGDKSDWMFMLVRTSRGEKKQQGITFVLIDMQQPGVEARPIKLISGASPFCETFFTDARARLENVISGLGNGWNVAKALLGHERSMIGSRIGSSTQGGPSDPSKNALAELARSHLGERDGELADPVLRDRIAQLSMDDRCFALTAQRNADGMKTGHGPGPESSIFKILATELKQRREELMLSIRGPQCLGWEGAGFTQDALEQTRNWLRSRGNTIEGGTSEVQLNIIAKRVLGLPD